MPVFLQLLIDEALLLQFWNLIALMATPSTTPALFGGGLLGYVMYDVTHYYLHHGQPTSEVPKSLKVSRSHTTIQAKTSAQIQHSFFIFAHHIVITLYAFFISNGNYEPRKAGMLDIEL